tara:strand:+ start:1068 stop:2360 length:1293 start_codon:yes stop_codon:yes gene_type:complete
MATLIVYANGQSQEPTPYSLAYNDNRYVISSTQWTSTLRFRVNILPLDYPVAPAIASLVVYPSVGIYQGSPFQNHAWFDVSRIMQSLLSHDVNIPAADHQAFSTNGNSHAEYFLSIQEEDISAVSDRYEQVGVTIFKPKSVWNGVQALTDWLDFDYNDFIINTASTTKRFLTSAPSTRYVNTGQSAWLHYIVTDKFAKMYEIKSYSEADAAGTLLATGIVTSPYATASTYDERFWRIPIGPSDITKIDASLMSASTPTTVLNGAKSYVIRLLNTSLAQVSEAVTFNVDQQCSKYEPVRLHWLNKLGGIDSMNFNLKSIEKTDVKRESYHQQHHTFTGFAYDYTKASRGQVDYDIKMTETLKVNTDYLTEAESIWMEDLFTSPVVYRELNNELISMNITGKSIQKKTSLNDKLMQYSFDLNYSLTNRRQRG